MIYIKNLKMLAKIIYCDIMYFVNIKCIDVHFIYYFKAVCEYLLTGLKEFRRNGGLCIAEYLVQQFQGWKQL